MENIRTQKETFLGPSRIQIHLQRHRSLMESLVAGVCVDTVKLSLWVGTATLECSRTENEAVTAE
jgi:hypothetical protein